MSLPDPTHHSKAPTIIMVLDQIILKLFQKIRHEALDRKRGNGTVIKKRGNGTTQIKMTKFGQMTTSTMHRWLKQNSFVESKSSLLFCHCMLSLY